MRGGGAEIEGGLDFEEDLEEDEEEGSLAEMEGAAAVEKERRRVDKLDVVDVVRGVVLRDADKRSVVSSGLDEEENISDALFNQDVMLFLLSFL